MKSELTIVVIVTDQNDSPSTPRSVHVIVHSFNGKTPLGKIADVHPNDPDVTGAFSCKILQGSNSRVLTIPTACDLHTNKITSGYSSVAECHFSRDLQEILPYLKFLIFKKLVDKHIQQHFIMLRFYRDLDIFHH